MSEKPKALATGSLLHVGINADCYVLANGLRVLSQRGIIRALTGGRETGAIAPYLTRLPNSSALLAAGAIEFEVPGGGTAIGRTDEWFVAMLQAYKRAWRDGLLKSSQEGLAKNADAMLDAMAAVGLRALIDEATGYQNVREHGELASLYSRWLLVSAATWLQHWPEDVLASLANSFFNEKLRAVSAADIQMVKALSDQSRDKHDFMRRMAHHFGKQPLQLDLTP